MKPLRTPLAAIAFGGLILLLVWQQLSGPPEGGPYVLNAQAPSSRTSTGIVTAANTFLASLTDAQRMQGTFAFGSSQRTGWSNLPSPMFRRNGLRLGDLMPAQRSAALALMAAALSREGYQKITDIMNGVDMLKYSGGGRTGGRPGGGGRGGGPKCVSDE